MNVTITLGILVITVLISIGGFSNHKIIDDLIFYPPSVKRGQFYRFFTHGLIHADPVHLIFNMIALDSFGKNLEMIFEAPFMFGSYGKFVYLGLYVTALMIASVPDYFRHKDHYHYRSLGASGAVSAVIFATIMFDPISGIGFAFIPNLSIPGYIFAIIYLVISTVLAKKGTDNIGHTAHITGAIYGMVFMYAATKLFTNVDILREFWARVTGQ
ncbi:MAG: rhomboid family intramembrane serine protease [Chitinophagaceae bacterium]|nr:rhomboid family intramembrane serine protease [Chitinophagaceae bacterium]